MMKEIMEKKIGLRIFRRSFLPANKLESLNSVGRFESFSQSMEVAIVITH